MAIWVGGLMSIVLTSYASVTLDGTNNLDFSNMVWTVSDFNGAPPTVAGDGGPVASGSFDGIGTLDASGEFVVSFTTVSGYDTTASTNAIAGGTFGSYISGLTPALLNNVVYSMGINSGSGDSNINFISDDEALIIELVDTTNITKAITLEDLGWVNETLDDRADILIYHAASNSVIEVQWNERPSAYTGSYSLGEGDKIVIGNRAALYRLDTVTVDIAPAIALTNVLPVAGLEAVADDAQVQLSWTADSTGFLESYNVYRTITAGTNYAQVATGVSSNSYSDTNVVNDTTYYYAVTAVGADAYETELSAEVSALPSAALIIINLTNAEQGDTRSAENTETSTYQTNGTIFIYSAIKAGEYGQVEGGPYYLSRPVVKFPLGVADLGAKTTNDIARVVLKMYLNQSTLMDAPEGTQLDVYASQAEAANTSIIASDFESPSYSKIATWTSITTNSPEMAYYEVDVTEMVLADLNSDVQDATAGSCFRLQLTGDTSLSSTNNPFGGLVSVRFDDNTEDNPPQLRIEFTSTASLYDNWVAEWGVNIGESTNDFDADGLNNLYEYGLGGNPTNGVVEPAYLPYLEYTGSDLNYYYVQRSDDPALTYTVKTTTNLVGGIWDSMGYTVSGTNVGFATELDEVINQIDLSIDQRFIRLLIEQ
jgi:fibronectin type 3 domain-containing protein